MKYILGCVFLLITNINSLYGDDTPNPNTSSKQQSSTIPGSNVQGTFDRFQPLLSSLKNEFEPVLQKVKESGGDTESIKSSIQKIDLNGIMQKMKDSDLGPTINKFQSEGSSLWNSFLSNIKNSVQKRQKRKIPLGCTFFPDLHNHRW